MSFLGIHPGLGTGVVKRLSVASRSLVHHNRSIHHHVCKSSPWDKDTIQKLIVKELESEERSLGEAWENVLPSDPNELYDEIERAQEQWNFEFDMIQTLPKYKQADAYFQHVKIPPVLANHVIGMGTWRLKATVDPIIQILVARLEGSMRSILQTDLNLYPPSTWKGTYDFVDSVDPKREWDNWAWVDIPSPRPGEEGYPRLLLENRIYMSRTFRKLHFEVAARQDGLQVLHLVLFPRYSFDLPIFALDLVVSKGNVTLAIVDAVPVRQNRTLPPHYMEVMRRFQDTFLVDAQNARIIPDWGQDILSPLCICIRPQSAEELAGFCKYTIALFNAHLKLSHLAQPVEDKSVKGSAILQEILTCHKRFCDKNLENKKTSRVLEAALGEEMTRHYMEKIMFDFNPEDDPEWTDGGIARFLEHMEKNPPKDPLWEHELMVDSVKQQAQVDEQMSQLADIEAAMNDMIDSFESQSEGLTHEVSQFLLENDPEFRDILAKLFASMQKYDEDEKLAAMGAVKEAYHDAYQKWYVP